MNLSSPPTTEEMDEIVKLIDDYVFENDGDGDLPVIAEHFDLSHAEMSLVFLSKTLSHALEVSPGEAYEIARKGPEEGLKAIEAILEMRNEDFNVEDLMKAFGG